MGSMSFRWTCTVHVRTRDEYDPSAICTKDGVAFACWGFESAPTTGQLHWHVYIRFTSKKRLSTVKSFLERDDAHCELCKGSEQANIDYCGKHGDYGQIGEPKPDAGKQGKRSDLEDIAEKVKAGATLQTIAEEHSASYIRYHGGIAALSTAIAKPPASRDVEVLWLWGPTGTGKTHRILTAFPDCFSVTPGRSPWDGYTSQSLILFDEFSGELNWPLDMMKRYLDKWRLQLDARYNNKFAAWTRVVICSNNSPASFYPTASGPDIEAFRRRIYGHCRLVLQKECDGGPTLEEILQQDTNPF